MIATERCPRCRATLAAMTNGLGNCFLECFGCQHVEAVRQIPSPFPDRVYRDHNQHLRRRHTRLPDTFQPRRHP